MQGNDKYERFLFRRSLFKFTLIFVYCRANSASHKTHESCCLLRENHMLFVPNKQTFISVFTKRPQMQLSLSCFSATIRKNAAEA